MKLHFLYLFSRSGWAAAIFLLALSFLSANGLRCEIDATRTAPEDKHAWGFIDKNGSFTIPPQFNGEGKFRGGFTELKTSDGVPWSKGIIDRSGQPISPYTFNNIFNHITENRWVVQGPLFAPDGQKLDSSLGQQSNFWTYFDKSGGILHRRYHSCGVFYRGRAPAVLDKSDAESKSGKDTSVLVGHDGSVILYIPGDLEASEFSEGLIPIRVAGKSNFMDIEGHVVLKTPFLFARSFSNGLAAVAQTVNGKFGWGFINRTGKLIIPIRYEQVEDFRDGCARVVARNSYGCNYINEKGECIYHSWNFKRSTDFSEGLAAATNIWGWYEIFDKTGHVVFSMPSKSMGKFNDGLCFASAGDSEESLFGFVDRSGQWKIEPQFRNAADFSEGLAAVAIVKPGTRRTNSNEQWWTERLFFLVRPFNDTK